MSKIRLGVMGGTFDPIHFGHLVAANEAAWALKLDKVIFVPTGNPWQKSKVSSADHRYAMTNLAIAGSQIFQISDVDLKRDGPTFTVDTLQDIQALHPDAELYFVTGADAISQILSWKDVDQLWDKAHFVAVSRPGHDLKLPKSPEGAITLLDIPALAISSTDIRARVKSGKPFEYLLPDSVIEYIKQNNLYQGTE